MTWNEAINQMKLGKKIRHEYFSSEEFFEMKNNKIVCEQGCDMTNWYRDEEWQKDGFYVI